MMLGIEPVNPVADRSSTDNFLRLPIVCGSVPSRHD